MGLIMLPVKCFDCKELTTDFVIEPRQTGGTYHTQQHEVWMDHVPVHSDRKLCKQLQAHKGLQAEYDYLIRQGIPETEQKIEALSIKLDNLKERESQLRAGGFKEDLMCGLIDKRKKGNQ